jgi:acyl-CoA thioester hydrolase
MTIETEIEQPAAASYTEELVAPVSDVDELGHVSNLAYVRWIQEIAKAHSRAVGWDYAAYLRLGAVFVVRRHEIDYLAPVFAGERVRLVTWVSSFSAATSTRRTRVLRIQPDAAPREVARATTLWALVATEGGRPRRVPKELRAAFAAEALSDDERVI